MLCRCCRWKARTNRLLDERIDPQAHQQALDGLASSRSELATRQEELTRSRAEVSQLNRQLTESRSEAAAAATQVRRWAAVRADHHFVYDVLYVMIWLLT